MKTQRRGKLLVPLLLTALIILLLSGCSKNQTNVTQTDGTQGEINQGETNQDKTNQDKTNQDENAFSGNIDLERLKGFEF